MSGNVMEWCWDWYDPNYYKKSPKNNPTGPVTGKYKVYRGGSFIHSIPELRCANRDGETPDANYPNLGFRVVKEIPDTSSTN